MDSFLIVITCSTIKLLLSGPAAVMPVVEAYNGTFVNITWPLPMGAVNYTATIYSNDTVTSVVHTEGNFV